MLNRILAPTFQVPKIWGFWRVSVLSGMCVCACVCVCVFVKVNLTQHRISHFRVYSSVAFSVSTVLYNHMHLALHPVPQHSHHPKGKSQALSPHSLSLSPWQPLLCFPSLWTDLLWIFHVNGLIQHMAFCVWLLSASGFWGSSIW